MAKQPAGYQAVLRVTMHEVAVNTACIASKSGLVALGDASGDLSVLNLFRVCGAAFQYLPHSYFIVGTDNVHDQVSGSHIPQDTAFTCICSGG